MKIGIYADAPKFGRYATMEAHSAEGLKDAVIRQLDAWRAGGANVDDAAISLYKVGPSQRFEDTCALDAAPGWWCRLWDRLNEEGGLRYGYDQLDCY